MVLSLRCALNIMRVCDTRERENENQIFNSIVKFSITNEMNCLELYWYMPYNLGWYLSILLIRKTQQIAVGVII